MACWIVPKGASIKDVRTWGREGVRKKEDKNGQGVGGDLAESSRPLLCDLYKREEDI